VDEETQYITAPLTSDRTITLGTSTALKGDFFRVVRSADSAGAFTFSVGGLKTLSTSQWADVQYNGTDWVLTGAGSL
jgi:hypothetical protein